MLARKGPGLEMRARAVFMLIPYLIPTVHGVFQPAHSTELKAGVELYMRDPEEAKRLYGGDIGEWDISLVDDTSKLFCGWRIVLF